ncbi:ABC transporter substrate-binding protein [Neobacillus bataviensis]|uniref:ABC transporter substrate-binding protein n=1 Tax=Neobacillus bataviensis TaxID=220685 RepID=UPI001CBCAD41|nr:sugar ABC transporter substrate-binding protein [Neobacillus bataviensis]
MKWNKKIVAVINLALVLIIMIAGCSSNSANVSKSESSAKSKKVVTLQFTDFQYPIHQKLFKELVDEYNASQDKVKIKYSSAGNANDYSNTKLPVAFANNEGPDIFMTSAGDFKKYADAGIMADLTPYFPKGAIDDFLPSTIEAVTYKDKILALPFELELLGLYYNKKMLKDANVKVPETWEELSDAARKLTTDKVAGLVLPTDIGPYLNFIWYPFQWQQGGSVLNEDGTKSTFNSPENVKALDYWGSFFQKGYSPSKLQYGAGDIDNIATGSAAMQISGTWSIAALEDKFPDFEAGLVPIPIPNGGKHASDGGGWKLAVNAKSEHVKEAADFIMWAFAEDTSRPLKWAKTKSAYPARKSVIEEGKDYYQTGLRKIFTDEIYNTATPEPQYGPEIVDAIGKALQNVMFGKMSGKEAAKIADEKIQQVLDSK